jgi:hypothetical protein
MKQHEYEITVKHIADAQGNPSTYTDALQFKAYNHDDIFKVLGFVQNSQILDEESAKAFAVGLKLFGEVMLENKEIPLFKDFMPQFVQFMKALKKTAKPQE